MILKGVECKGVCGLRKAIIAGNWKMFKTEKDALQFAEAVKGKTDVEGVEAVICAPFINLPAMSKAVEGTSLKLGAQNMHWEEDGAYTGEISPSMLTSLGVTHVIIGHSERRAYFAETDETVNKKVHAAIQHGVIPIVCVGESLEQREQQKTEQVCQEQVEAALAGLTSEQLSNVVIAYEPIWAIGTGRSSSAEDANQVISFIRQTIANQFDSTTANQIRIQYGGSVKPENIGEYMAQPDIDGALVGGASLEPDSYVELLKGAVR